MPLNIHDEVRREVARCVTENIVLRIAPAAARIAADRPHSGLSAAKVASMLLEAGISAAVPIEIDTPEDRESAQLNILG
jgi:hypothetical protein